MAAHGDLPAVQVHDALCQRQPQSTAIHPARVRPPIELFENTLQVIRRNAGPGIGHFDDDGPSVLECADFHGIF